MRSYSHPSLASPRWHQTKVTKLWRISAAFLLVLPAFASSALVAQTTAPALPSDPAANSSAQAVQVPPPQAPNSVPQSPLPELGTILGTVTDVNDFPVAAASIGLQGAEPSDVRSVVTNDNGFFEIRDVQPGIPYRVTITAQGFAPWESPVVILKPGQHEILDVGKLRIGEVQTAITVTPGSSDEIAIQEVKVEETQRGFGIIPNFFAAYGPDPAPLTARLKFSLAFRVVRDPFTAFGVAILAGAGQAEGSPNYVQGLRGYGERFGANYANQATDLMFGGAILPSLLHQDPRYFYQGTGSVKSRALHAISSLIITKGDNGRWQPNYSSFGGDLASASISNLYYPASNRGAGLVFQNFAVDTAVHLGVRLLQEFLFHPTRGTVVTK
jgi:hypothetical protein